jgi:hypothetical protein
VSHVSVLTVHSPRSSTAVLGVYVDVDAAKRAVIIDGGEWTWLSSLELWEGKRYWIVKHKVRTMSEKSGDVPSE